jgi:chromosome segregation ATPase
MSEAIGQSSACCAWQPCGSDQNEGLKGRVCPLWRIIPGLLTLAALVVAVVCSIVWNCPYLCIVYGLGGIASIYLIYLGCNYAQLKSLGENNDQLEESIRTLNSENEELAKKLETFEEENQKLKETTTKMSDLVKNLESENCNLSDTNQKLQTTVSDLEQLKETLDKKAGAHVKQLENFKGALTDLQGSTEKNHATFGEMLEKFIKEVEILETARTNFESTGSDIEAKMKQQVLALLDAAEVMKGIFTKINEWKDNDLVKKQIEAQQLLGEQMFKLRDTLSKNEGKLEEQVLQIKELASIKEGFQNTLTNLLEEIDKLKNVNADLKKDAEKVTKAAKAFQIYGLKTSY